MWAFLAATALSADFGFHELGEFYPLDEVYPDKVHEAARSVVDLDYATGFVVSADGYVLTNAHVSDELGELVIARMSVDRSLVILDLIEADSALDVALYKIRQDTKPWLPIRGRGPTESEKVAVLGHPGGSPLRVSFGSVLTEDGVVAGIRSVEYSAQTWWGSSGSPVIDRRGRALAVHWGWDSGGRYHGRLTGVPLVYAAEKLPLLDSIRACPDPERLEMVAEPIEDDGTWYVFRLRLVGDPACVAEAERVVWHLHPTFDDPDVEVLTGGDFGTSIAVWGSFAMTATVDLGGREVEVAGRVDL